MSEAALSYRLPRWLQRLRDALAKCLCERRERQEHRLADLTGREGPVLRDIGLTPETFIVARAAEEGAPGRTGFDS